MEDDKKSEQIKQMLGERAEKDGSEPASLKDELAEAKKYYVEKGSTVKVKSVFAKDGFYYPDDDEIYKLKHDFIVEITGVSVEKKDADFQSHLKDVAKKFDEKLNGNVNDSLFLGLVSSYPELLSKSDLKWMVDNVKGKKEKFVSLCDFILGYINPEKEPNVCDKDSITDEEILKRFNFIWEIFKAIKSYGDGWAKIGEYYLDSLFGDDYVSFDIFTTRFFKKRRAKSFISEVSKYAAKYLKGGRFDLHSTEIYDHYRQVKKAEKKRNLIVVVASVVVVAAAAAGSVAFIKSINTDTIEFHGDKSIVLGYTYGSSPDLSGWYITYKTRDGAEHTEKVDLKMISGVNERKIGEQQTVTITFGGKTVQIQIRIDPATLAAPVITRAGTDVTWEAVPNATGYEIYVSDVEITAPQGAPTATVAENVTSFNVAAVCKPGKANVYVRAIFTDGNDNDSDNAYKNSALSNGVKVEKLGAVTALTYRRGTLGWAAVENANKYRITVDGTIVSDGVTGTSYSYNFTGGEKIVVTAISDDETFFSSTAEFTVNQSPEIGYDGKVVSWEGGTLYNFTITDESGNVKHTGRDNASSSIDVRSLSLARGIYTVYVQTSGSGSYVSSPEKVIKIAYGYNISVDNADGTQKIKWDGVSGVTEYKVYIDGVEQSAQSATEYPINATLFREAKKYSIEIVTSDNIRLGATTITKLKAPELVFNKSASAWTKITAESGRSVEYTADGVTVGFDALPTSFEDDHEYVVSARITTANPDEINSEATTVTLYKLKTPTVIVDYTNGEKLSYVGAEEGVTLNCYYKSGDLENSFSLGSARTDSTVDVYGRLSASSYKNYTYVIDSSNSDPIKISKYAKPIAPTYNTNDTLSVGTDSASDYTFYYRTDGNAFTALPGNSMSELPAGSYDVYAVRKGKQEGNVYYVSSDGSDSIQVAKANIIFTIEYRGTAVAVVFGEGSDEKDFEVTGRYWVDGEEKTITKATKKWSDRGKNNDFTVIRASGVTKVEITIEMNGVKVTRTWEN